MGWGQSVRQAKYWNAPIDYKFVTQDLGSFFSIFVYF